jgi:hypothetical protein
MPYVQFGEDLNFSNNKFTKLKKAGEKIRFRILGTAFYEGKHFIKGEDDKWKIFPCLRINQKEECEYCKTYFQTLDKAAEFKDTDEKLFKEGKKEAEKFKAAIMVYYPIINRDTEQFQIFQTGMGTRKKIEAEVAMEIPVLERDYIVIRTEEPGANYYTLSRVDSADSKPLTTKEKEQIKLFKETNLEKIITGVKDEESKLNEDINVDDIDL